MRFRLRVGEQRDRTAVSDGTFRADVGPAEVLLVTTLDRMSETEGIISVRLAMSLDGYIADRHGDYD